MPLQHCIVCIFWHSALSILALATLWYLDTPCSPLPAAAALKSEIAPIIRIINFVSSSLSSSSASTSGQPPAAGSAEKNFSRPECCQLMLTPDPHQQLKLRRCCCWRLLSANLKDNGRKWQDRNKVDYWRVINVEAILVRKLATKIIFGGKSLPPVNSVLQPFSHFISCSFRTTNKQFTQWI